MTNAENAEARFNNSLRSRKPEGSLGRTAQDGHLDSHTAPELWWCRLWCISMDTDHEDPRRSNWISISNWISTSRQPHRVTWGRSTTYHFSRTPFWGDLSLALSFYFCFYFLQLLLISLPLFPCTNESLAWKPPFPQHCSHVLTCSFVLEGLHGGWMGKGRSPATGPTVRLCWTEIKKSLPAFINCSSWNVGGGEKGVGGGWWHWTDRMWTSPLVIIAILSAALTHWPTLSKCQTV